MSNKHLSQEEIDALLNQKDTGETGTHPSTTEFNGTENSSGISNNEDAVNEALTEKDDNSFLQEEHELLSPEEKDALGEIGNISMGSSSTTLSELLQKRVTITSPKVRVMTQGELLSNFQVPYMVIQVEFKEGLAGFNVLVIQLQDARVLANLMMGNEDMDIQGPVSEIEVSAASEAMNQMIGTASTSLADMFGRSINISPPVTSVLETPENTDFQLLIEDPIVVVSFRMTVEQSLDTEIMQVMSMETAKELAYLLWEGINPEKYANDLPQSGLNAEEQALPDTWQTPGQQNESTPVLQKRQPELQVNKDRLAILMDIPLHATVVLGRAKKTIKEVLDYTPGSVVELSSQVEEPVEVLVNGVPVARGEVVVVNENFGVRITDILTPAERVAKLTESE